MHLLRPIAEFHVLSGRSLPPKQSLDRHQCGRPASPPSPTVQNYRGSQSAIPSETFPVRQDFYTLLIKVLQRNVAPNRDESVWKATSMWHPDYARQFTNFAGRLLYILLGLFGIKKCRFLRAIDV
jgi:hypothetical protein